MDTSNFNEYINFEKLFTDLVNHLEYWDDFDKDESQVFNNVYSFSRDLKIDSILGGFSIQTDECSLTENKIWFSFSQSNNDSNESTSMSSYTMCEVEYDRDSEVFTHFNVECG